MKITVCELNTDTQAFENDWKQLVAHVKTETSNLVLLPEMPFYPWFPKTRQVDISVWNSAVDAHDRWETRLHELSPAIVIGSRPINTDGKRLNQGFAWEEAYGYRVAHTKYYLPDAGGFWEASWYDRGDGKFSPIQTSKAQIGFVICSDIWFTEHARAYGKKGVHLIANPRATRKSTFEKWLVGGRAVSLVSGAFCISSNHYYFKENEDPELGGKGWIISPNGDVIGLTSREQPFITADIDLTEAEYAKQTYPRNVLE